MARVVRVDAASDAAVTVVVGAARVSVRAGFDPVLLRHASVHEVIEEAIERHAQRAARHVRVAITDGTVFLSGEVRPWAELTAIEGAVRAIPGVNKIDSQVHIVA